MSDTRNDYEMVKQLGKGAFGVVYLVKNKTDDKQSALKVIDLSSAPEDERQVALREAKLLSEFRHAHILQYIDSFESGGALCILTEFCCNGDVAGYLQQRNQRPLPESQIIGWFSQICSALQYLHGKNVLHRDLKTQNIFLMSDYSTKLGDLGLAKVLENPNSKAVTFCGSPYYMSPEIFSCRPYDMKSDIWALGVCIYEMATLEKPFDAMMMHQLVFKIVHGELPEMPRKQYSAELILLLEQMLTKDAAARPTADAILTNPLFRRTTISKTPPPLFPKPKHKPGERVSDMSTFIHKLLDDEDDTKHFDMNSLLSVLSTTSRTEDYSSTLSGLETIKDTFVDLTKDKTVKNIGVKTTKNITGFKSQKASNTPSESSSSASSCEGATGADMYTFGAQSSGEASHMMNVVVRTLTGLFQKGTDDDQSPKKDAHVDPERMLLRQIDQLQAHCAKVLGMEKFMKAYEVLNQTRDDVVLEEKLIKVLGKAAFAQCGVQLFYCKNFEYNLEKMKNERWQGNI